MGLHTRNTLITPALKLSTSYPQFFELSTFLYNTRYFITWSMTVYINNLHKCMLLGLFCDCQDFNRMTASVKLSDNSVDRGYIFRKQGLPVLGKAGVALTLPHPLINPHFITISPNLPFPYPFQHNLFQISTIHPHIFPQFSHIPPHTKIRDCI